MILFPAIDLKEGQCVRLIHGNMDTATVFNSDPVAQASLFESQGFEFLHIVDLNGAFAGEPVNIRAVKGILAKIKIPTQLGGGIRDLRTIETWLNEGVRRVIIGTAAVSDPALVHDAARKFPGRVAVGIDARDGFVAVEGWATTTTLSSLELGKRFEGAGVSAIVFTDISRDGVMTGINIESTKLLADALHIPVIASGGLGSIEDIRRLIEPDCGKIAGVISGRALYDGRLDPAEALGMLRQMRGPSHA